MKTVIDMFTCDHAGRAVKGKSLDELVLQLSASQEPLVFKETLMAIARLYFSGISEGLSPLPLHLPRENQAAKQREISDALIAVMKDTVVGLYAEGEIQPERILNQISPHFLGILLYGSKKQPEYTRRIPWTEGTDFPKFFNGLSSLLDGMQVNVVVPVLRSGLEPALMVLHQHPNANVFLLRYSATRHDLRVRRLKCFTEEDVSEAFRGKSVLIVDDIIHTGSTLVKVAKYVQGYKPASIYATGMSSHAFTDKPFPARLLDVTPPNANTALYRYME